MMCPATASRGECSFSIFNRLAALVPLAALVALTALAPACGDSTGDDDDDSSDTAGTAGTTGGTTGSTGGTTATGDGGGDDDDSSGTTGGTTAGTDTGGETTGGADVTKTVGAAGGEIALDTTKVTIPAGALPDDVQVGVTELDAPRVPLPVSAGVASGPVVRFVPHGIQFTKPVTIRIALSRTPDTGASLKIARLANETAETWALADAANIRVENGEVVFEVTTFSDLVPVDGPCNPECGPRKCGPGDIAGCALDCGTCPGARDRCMEGMCFPPLDTDTTGGDTDTTGGTDTGGTDTGGTDTGTGCVPDCDGKQCGDDGCGGKCGTPCSAGKASCLGPASIQFPGNPQCNGTTFQCEVVGVSGSPCPQGQVCQPDVAAGAKCVVAGGGCTPNCTNKTCGDDGCGGSCGECGPNGYCDYTGGQQCVTGLHCPDYTQATLAGSPWPMDRGCAARVGLSNATAPTTAPPIKWSYDFGATYLNNGTPTPTPVRSTPVIDADGNAVLYGPDGKGYRINYNGTKGWDITLGGSGYENGVKTKLPSPLLDDTGRVYFVSSSVDTNPPASKLNKFRPTDGAFDFQTLVGRFAYSSPLIDPTGVVWLRTDYIEKFVNGVTNNWTTRPSASVASQYGGIAYDRDSQRLVWGAARSSTTDPVALSITKTPASATDYAWKYGASSFSFSNGETVETTPAVMNGIAVFQAENGQSSGHPLFAINVADGAEVWNQFTLGISGNSPAITRDGLVISAYEKDTANEVLIARKLTDGSQVWAYKHTATVGFTTDPVIDNNGLILVGDSSGQLVAIGHSGKKAWSVQVCDKPIRAAPAIHFTGRIYVGCDDGKLYALRD